MKISVLIASITERAAKLAGLIDRLRGQVSAAGADADVEIVTYVDERGRATIGAKRNQLMDAATGDYTCFIDDDDLPGARYVELLLAAAADGADCARLIGLIKQGTETSRFVHEVGQTSWHRSGGIYYRPPNHLNLVRAPMARSVRFPETNFGEDKDWSLALLATGQIKTQFWIDDVIYLYTPSSSGVVPGKPRATAATRPRRV